MEIFLHTVIKVVY